MSAKKPRRLEAFALPPDQRGEPDASPNVRADEADGGGGGAGLDDSKRLENVGLKVKRGRFSILSAAACGRQRVGYSAPFSTQSLAFPPESM